MIRVLLVAEFQLIGNVISSALEDEPDIEVVGCTSDANHAIALAREKDLDVVLISTRLPDGKALDLIRVITRQMPDIDVLALGLTENKEQILEYVEAGASGYVLKNDTLEELLSAIRAATRGKARVSPEIAAALMERVYELSQMFSNIERGVATDAELTPREVEILELLGKNMTNKEIAGALSIEVGTVKNHVHSILNKLDVTNREQAATYLAFIRK